MATKNIKSAGSAHQFAGQTKSYWENAAKQFIWPIDFTDLQILVPEKDLELAAGNLMVTHFRAAGWHIQSAIVEYTKPFVAPTSNGAPIFKPIPGKVTPGNTASEFTIGQQVKVISSECELEVTHLEKGKVHLAYTNRPRKPPLLVSEEQLKKALSFGTWVRI